MRNYAIDTGFAEANGVWRYAGTIATTKSNQDTATPFLNETATLTLVSLLATHSLVVTPVLGGRVVTLTGVAGAAANENQFSVDGADDAADAAALAAAWNAHSVLASYASAGVSSNVVTLTAKQGAPLLTITQGTGATITIARGANFGQSLAGKTLLLQAAGDTRIGWGASSAAAIAEADSTNGFLLADGASRVCLVPDDISHLASTGASLRVYRCR